MHNALILKKNDLNRYGRKKKIDNLRIFDFCVYWSKFRRYSFVFYVNENNEEILIKNRFTKSVMGTTKDSICGSLWDGLFENIKSSEEDQLLKNKICGELIEELFIDLYSI